MGKTEVQVLLQEGKGAKEVLHAMREEGGQEQDVIAVLWSAVMAPAGQEQEQAVRLLKQHLPLLRASTSSPESALHLCGLVQEWCGQQGRPALLGRLLVALYQGEVLCEGALLQWYRGAASAGSRAVLRRFALWLESGAGHLRRQGAAVSEGALLSLLSPPTLHPWLQEGDASLPRRGNFASSLCKGVARAKVLRLLLQEGGQPPESLVSGLVEEEDRELAGEVVEAALQGTLSLPCTILALLLDSHPCLLVDQLELLILQALKDGARGVLNSVLVDCLAKSESMFLTTMNVFLAYLLATSYSPHLVRLYQQLCARVQGRAEQPLYLFPLHLQGLALLLLTWGEVGEDRGELEGSIRGMVREGGKMGGMVLLQFPEVLEVVSGGS